MKRKYAVAVALTVGIGMMIMLLVFGPKPLSLGLDRPDQKLDKVVINPMFHRPRLRLIFKGHVINSVMFDAKEIGDPTRQGRSAIMMSDTGVIYLPPHQDTSFVLTIEGWPEVAVEVVGVVEGHKDWGPAKPVVAKIKLDKSGEKRLAVYVGKIYDNHIHFE